MTITISHLVSRIWLQFSKWTAGTRDYFESTTTASLLYNRHVLCMALTIARLILLSLYSLFHFVLIVWLVEVRETLLKPAETTTDKSASGGHVTITIKTIDLLSGLFLATLLSALIITPIYGLKGTERFTSTDHLRCLNSIARKTSRPRVVVWLRLSKQSTCYQALF